MNEQQQAIREILRAKTDREIARMLRQSYRLLNLHKRKPSNISHREPWTEYELKLLGKMRDEEMSKIFTRSTTAIAAKRESLGIPIFAPNGFDGPRGRLNCWARDPILLWLTCWAGQNSPCNSNDMPWESLSPGNVGSRGQLRMSHCWEQNEIRSLPRN